MAVKHIHMLTALISIAGFVLRGLWMMGDSPLLQKKLTKILPHINDTVLLASAVFLAITTSQYPFVTDWVTAKVVALLVYIGLGMVAFRFGKTRLVKNLAFFLALFCFAYIVSVARSHNPLPFLS